MARIVRLTVVESIKPGPGSTIAPDGTIIKPEPYRAVDIEFDDGVIVQVERPLNAPKVQAARQAAAAGAGPTIDGISVGDVVP